MASMTRTLHLVGEPEADKLLSEDPLALLLGMLLDQQVAMEVAFNGPKKIADRMGGLDAVKIAEYDPEQFVELCVAKPAIHRYPAKMAERVHDLAVYVLEHHGGDAERVWSDAPDAETLRASIAALPGFGEMKVKALGSVLAKRFGVAAAEGLVPWHPTLGDVDSAQALADYQAAKRAHKAEWSKIAVGGR